MKFWLAWLVYAIFGILLAAGMILAHAGNWWLLITAGVGYGLALFWFGCRQTAGH
ncbi:MAG: hypothetical protein RMN51_01385 [Verrucomicrobiota bacterium]|nr:hypothetical protein [Limisphaera sp.]MDW8380751.1 hypothetical protein [Verrucomicrobiota bacterium]